MREILAVLDGDALERAPVLQRLDRSVRVRLFLDGDLVERAPLRRFVFRLVGVIDFKKLVVGRFVLIGVVLVLENDGGERPVFGRHELRLVLFVIGLDGVGRRRGRGAGRFLADRHIGDFARLDLARDEAVDHRGRGGAPARDSAEQLLAQHFRADAFLELADREAVFAQDEVESLVVELAGGGAFELVGGLEVIAHHRPGDDEAHLHRFLVERGLRRKAVDNLVLRAFGERLFGAEIPVLLIAPVGDVAVELPLHFKR